MTFVKRVKKAVILAAGRGTRMAALTAETPKPLLEVAGKALIEHVLDRLKVAGLSEFLIVVGYLGERIRERLEEYPARTVFAEQVEINGTGRAALLAEAFADGEPFLLTFGDILAQAADYVTMIDLMEAGTSAVIAAKDCDDPYRGAAIYERRGEVERIVEKPPKGTSSTRWNSAGIYVFGPEVFEQLRVVPLSPRGEYEITSAVQQLVDARRRVRLYGVLDNWMDVGRPEDLAAAAASIDRA